MLPTISSGDIVIYRPVKYQESKLIEGSIIVAKHPLESRTLIIKRLYKNTKYGLELRGENKEESIDSRQFGLIQKENLHGIVEYIIPSSKKFYSI